MRILLTGATGYIGESVLDFLVRGGHDVTALVRNPARVPAMAVGQAHVVAADLGDTASWADHLPGHDVLIHTAFEASARGPAVDRAVVDALIAAARKAESAGARTTVIYTSGIWVLGRTEQAATEDAPVAPVPLVAWRPEHEQAILAASSPLVRTAVVRPGVVFGGSRGIVGDMLRDAANGIVRVVGSGQNRWPLVYLRDLAELYGVLATHPEGAGVFHATDDSEDRVIDIVDAIADHMKHRPDVRYMPIEEARAKMGPFADALALDQVVKSPRARALGWEPAFKRFTANVSTVFEEWRRGRE